jgi:hypothetical protein
MGLDDVVKADGPANLDVQLPCRDLLSQLLEWCQHKIL